MYVWMYVFMYVCMRVSYIYIYIYVYMYIWRRVVCRRTSILITGGPKSPPRKNNHLDRLLGRCQVQSVA